MDLPRGLEPGLLHELPEATRQDVLRSAEHRRFPARAEIYACGAPSGRFYLLLSGRAVQYAPAPSGRLQPLRWLKAGETSGESAWISPDRGYEVTLATRSPACALVWTSDTIRRLLRDPVLADNARTIVLDYIHAFIQIRVSSVQEDARTRVARTLISLSSSIGEFHVGGVMVHIDNQHLADLARVNVYDLSGFLQAWAREGLIRKGRGWVLLHRPELLLPRR
jgi:CRP-like cAMP-binding protein